MFVIFQFYVRYPIKRRNIKTGQIIMNKINKSRGKRKKKWENEPLGTETTLAYMKF